MRTATGFAVTGLLPSGRSCKPYDFVKHLLIILIVVATLRPIDAVAQRPPVPTSQEEIAAYLRTDDIPTLRQGISGASRIPYQQWSCDLQDAIVYALEMEIQRDAEAARQGVYRFADENLQSRLSRLVVVMQDPLSIRLLAKVAGASKTAALIDYGRRSLPHMIREVKEGGFSSSRENLIGLRQMVQHWGLDYFSDEERAELKALVSLFLKPGEPMLRNDTSKAILLYRAAQLGVALEDKEVRSWVQLLLVSQNAYQAKLGRQLTEFDKNRWRVWLRGGPMLPEATPLSDYFDAWREAGQYGLGEGT